MEVDTLLQIVPEQNERHVKPRYLRGYQWKWEDEDLLTPAADFSIQAPPMPAVPPSVLADPTLQQTLSSAPHLFRVVTPFNVPRLKRKLRRHPNQPFVQSVLQGLVEGFWPWASPVGLEGMVMDNHASCDLQPRVLAAMRDEELAAGRFSQPFSKLLPGMRISPLGLVPKPRSEKLRLITDHSAGSPSLNDFIPRDERKVAYDSMHAFAPWLVHLANFPVVHAWKSDVSHAFRLMPMHPLWQLNQVIIVDGKYHVDRNAVFGSAASPRLWCSVFSLVLWIARYELGINCLFSFVDDSWGLDICLELVAWRGHRIPATQALFLELLCYLDIPWAWEKQLHGSQLEIIGLQVDTVALTLSLSPERQTDLVLGLRLFVRGAKRGKRSLREFQQITGWASWALNVFPWGRWALQTSYDKMAGKTQQHALIPINREVKADLLWLADCLETSAKLSLREACSWSVAEADLVIYCDACPQGIGFWIPSLSLGFHAPLSDVPVYQAEAYCVLTAAVWAEGRYHRLMIYTDSLNTVDLFSRHRPTPELRPTLRAWSKLHLQHGTNPRVGHIAGLSNTIADALSRQMFTLVRQLHPSLLVASIVPPSLTAEGEEP